MDITQFEKELQNLTRLFQEELSKVRSGKVSFQLLESVAVDMGGHMMRLNQLAHTVIQGNLVTFEPWDESYIDPIIEAIKKAFNLNPQKDGKSVKVNFPPITDETKKNILKILSKSHEEIKISARNKRDELLKSAKRDKEEKKITEDMLFRLKERADKVIEKFNSELQRMSGAKEKEIMSA